MGAELQGATALVLGANGGIGEAIAEALADAGASLVLVARDLDGLERTRERLAGATVRVARVDATADDSVAALVASIEGLQVAVNNVGATHRPTPIDRFDLGELDRVLGTTLRATAVAMIHELAAMTDGGSVVNVASTAGLSGAPGMAAYAAAKHGVVGLTRTAALDVADRGIRVNAVAPGSTDSGALAGIAAEVKVRVGAGAPLGRLATAQEIASAVRWLASPGSASTTGTVLTVDGGRSAAWA